MKSACFDTTTLFQSTLPVRGATREVIDLIARKVDFNPRSPCGERHLTYCNVFFPSTFQSTLPVRGATQMTDSAGASLQFQSTLPVRGATDIWERATAQA